MLYRVIKAMFFTPVVSWILRPKLVHGDRIPEQGAAIIAPNHVSTVDSVSLGTLMKRKIRYTGKRELFEMRGPKALLGKFFLAVGQIPLDRSGGRSGASSLQPVVAALQQGDLVGIFPEGTRSLDGRLYRGHTGVARAALLSGVPVIPVGMVNIRVRRWLIFPTMHKARVVIGEPLDFSAYADSANDAAVLRWVTDEIMRHIQLLSGQTYVDVYGSQIKKGTMSLAESEQFVKAHPNFGVAAPQPSAGKES